MYLILSIAICLPVFCLSFIALNRAGCKVYYDSACRTLYRKGFFCGFKYALHLEDIKEIIAGRPFREDVSYIFIDTRNKYYSLDYKDSFIILKKTDETTKFIKEIWDKPINEYEDIHPTKGPLKRPTNII